MIKRINNSNEFYDYKIIDLFSVRIKSLLKAYGVKYDFASFYKYVDDYGNLSVIISKLDGDFTISYDKKFEAFIDYNEISNFIIMTGFNSVLTDEAFKFLPCNTFSSGVIMQSNQKTELPLHYAELDEFPKLMDLFDFENYDKWDFEAWYVDISHRIRHACAKAYAVVMNDEIVSSGIFSAMYNDCAVLSSVQTAPAFRGLGYGSALVSAMVCDVKDTVFLMREHNKNESFYSKLGFTNNSIWRLYK